MDQGVRTEVLMGLSGISGAMLQRQCIRSARVSMAHID
jgi:hypothetical protein